MPILMSNDFLNEAGAVVCQPFCGLGKGVALAEALLDDDDDKVLNVLTLDAFGGFDMCNGLGLTAVDSDPAVIANRLSVTRTALQVFLTLALFRALP